MKTDSDSNYLWAKKDTVMFIDRTESYAFQMTVALSLQQPMLLLEVEMP